MNEKHQVIDERQGATSASNAQADSLCAGRHLAQRGLPEVRGPWSETGSRIHAALHVGKPDGLSLEEVETFDACRSVEAKLVEQYFGAAAASGAMKVWREERAWTRFQDESGQWQHSGKPDVVYRLLNKCLVLEYKTLSGDVAESPRNMQLRDQAVLVRGTLLLDEVGVAVIQPLVTHSPTICFYDREELDRAAAELFARTKASNDPKSARSPGPAQCNYCLAKTHCLEYQRWAGGSVPMMQNLLDVPVASWTGEQCAQFLERDPVAQKWLDESKAAVKARVAQFPGSVPGWALKPGSTVETITDPQTCFDRFAKLGGKLEVFMSCIKVGKTKLKEALNAVTGAKGKSLESALGTVCQGITESKQNQPSLKKVTDA